MVVARALGIGLLVLSASCSKSDGEQSVDGGGGAQSVLPPPEAPQGCRTSLDCTAAPGDAAICDQATGACVQCVSVDDCGASEECVANACVSVLACENSLDCPTDLVCDASSARCVQCARDEDCEAGSVCAAALCRPECVSDRTCTPLGLLCDRALAHCVACFGDQDCSGAERCSAGACVTDGNPPVSTPDECPQGQKRCDGACVDAGPEVGCGALACGACPAIDNGTPICASGACAAQCDAGFVANGVSCQPPLPECSDGAQGGDEADVDCGGSTCPACANGKACGVDDDCAGGSCVGQLCRSEGCGNDQFDPGETDVDCGGVDCPACAPGAVCEADDDCDSFVCQSSSMRCAEPSCSDLTRNGDETGTDCGGPTCPKCPDGSKCVDAADCLNGVCEQLACRPAHCGNDALDQGETDVDCGGSCARCADGAACMTVNDCTSSVCTAMICQAPSCTDKYINGTESGPDCGGDCPPCGAYQGCRTPADCGVGDCVDGTCRQSCDGTAAACAPCTIPTFTPCCDTDMRCGCGLFGACIL